VGIASLEEDKVLVRSPRIVGVALSKTDVRETSTWRIERLPERCEPRS